MLDIPADVFLALEIAEYGSCEKVRQMAYKLLSGKLDRYGLRWEYFV